MAPEAIISIVPFASVLVAIVVTASIVWFITAHLTNLRWKRIFWPHADAVAEHKIAEQEAEIHRLKEGLERARRELTDSRRIVKSMKKVMEDV